MMRVTADMGRKNSGPPKPVVMLESSDDPFDDWLTPTQARAFAKKLISAADAAERKYEEWKARKVSPAQKPKRA